jgi:hypothetical protein
MYITPTQQGKELLQITLFVVAFHALFLVWMILTPSTMIEPKRTERLVVKTVQLKPQPIVQSRPIEPVIPEPEPEPEIIAEEPLPVVAELAAPVPGPTPEPPKPIPEPVKPIEKPAPPKPVKKSEPPPPSPTPKPAPKKVVPQKPTPKKQPSPEKKPDPPKKKPPPPKEPIKKAPTPIPVKKPTVDPKIAEAKVKAQKEAQERQQKLIATAQESVARIDKGRANMSAAKSNLNQTLAAAPVAIQSLQIEALPNLNAPPLTPGERSYRDELASRLKLTLTLPDHGEIQLKLTLDRNGRPLKINVVKAASSTNKSYIEKTLTNMKFPSFGNHFGDLSEYTFIIHLSNEL